MCGIVAYAGWRKVLPVLLTGLEQLEYRGYDSAGVACLEEHTGQIFFIKEKGKLSELKSRLGKRDLESFAGIGHTRWATHGEPSRENAHPHMSPNHKIAIVHNGIIENYAELKHGFRRSGNRFRSETDTEVAAHLLEQYYRGNLLEAMRRAVGRMRGFFSFVALCSDEPGRIVAFKRSNPLIVGVGNGEYFIASDVSAILPYTNKVIYLEDDEFVEIEKRGVRIFKAGRKNPVIRKASVVPWNVAQAQKGGFPHFMLKEIYEQPRVLTETLRKRITPEKRIEFDTVHAAARARLKKTKKIFFVSCGTAYHACMVGQYMIEEYAKIPVEVRVSSEFRYSNPVVTKEDVAILITQSGETADTLAALREARKKGAMTLAIVNVVGSTIAREADAVIYTHAGPEIGVASTKAYVAQLMTLTLFAFFLAGLRGALARSRMVHLIDEAEKIPQQVAAILNDSKDVRRASRALYRKRDFLFLGRGYNFPNALEGALKLKEITYSHAHGYAAGEMKHGPIALIDKHQPVICLIPFSKTKDKMVSNIEEIHARKGIIISIVTQGDTSVRRLSKWIFEIPRAAEVFSPVLTVVPLQLFAYRVAVLNKRDVDQPRNLAKSVTVE